MERRDQIDDINFVKECFLKQEGLNDAYNVMNNLFLYQINCWKILNKRSMLKKTKQLHKFFKIDIRLYDFKRYVKLLENNAYNLEYLRLFELG